ncbi:hypothetical protein R5R35_004621 [Gryllus longicercus]|uniref:Uncharacterized protein n=1 Tax=Gryllus longicercus TaxID=2509291 RepID=A0AAN9ZHP2_9ORTH
MALFLSFLIAIKNGWYDVVDVLNDSRYEHYLEAQDVNEQRPLHIAAKYNQLRIAMTLLARGARLDAQDRHGNTPLHLTVMFGAADVFKFLLRVGASTHILDIVGATAVDWLFCRPPATTTAHPELRSVYLEYMLTRIAYAVGGPVTLIYTSTPAPPYLPPNLLPSPPPLRRPFGGPSATTSAGTTATTPAAAVAADVDAAPRRTPPPPSTPSAPPRQETPPAHGRRMARNMDASRHHQLPPAPLPIEQLSREELEVLLHRQQQRTEQQYAEMERQRAMCIATVQQYENPATPHRQRTSSFSSIDTEINLLEEESMEDDATPQRQRTSSFSSS